MERQLLYRNRDTYVQICTRGDSKVPFDVHKLVPISTAARRLFPTRNDQDSAAKRAVDLRPPHGGPLRLQHSKQDSLGRAEGTVRRHGARRRRRYATRHRGG